MQLTGGRHLLSPEGPGSPDQGGCASGDAVDVGGFLLGGGQQHAGWERNGADETHLMTFPSLLEILGLCEIYTERF